MMGDTGHVFFLGRGRVTTRDSPLQPVVLMMIMMMMRRFGLPQEGGSPGVSVVLLERLCCQSVFVLIFSAIAFGGAVAAEKNLAYCIALRSAYNLRQTFCAEFFKRVIRGAEGQAIERRL